MATRHFVTGLQTAFYGDIHLHHFQNASGQFIALRQFFAFFFKRQIETVARLFQRVFRAFQLGRNFFFGWANIEPMETIDRCQISLVNLRTFGQFLRATIGDFAQQQFLDTVKRVGFHDTQLVVQIQTETLQLIVNNLLGTAVALNAFAGEDLHVNHRTLRTLVHAQRSVFHIAGFFTEDGTQQFFFGRERSFTLGCHFTDQRIAGHDFRTHVDDAGIVQTVELLFGQIGNIAGNFLRAQLGITRHDHEFFDVDRGVAVFCHHTLANQNRVLEVITVPRHKRDQHILTDSDFAQVGRSTVRHHIAFLQAVALLHDGTLVDVGILVGTLVFDEVVNIHTHFTGNCFIVVHAHHDTGGIHVIHDTATVCSHHRTRIHRRNALNARADHRFFRAQNGNRLT